MPQILGSLFFAFFPAVFLSVGGVFVLTLVISIPLANARRQILLTMQDGL